MNFWLKGALELAGIEQLRRRGFPGHEEYTRCVGDFRVRYSLGVASVMELEDAGWMYK